MTPQTCVAVILAHLGRRVARSSWVLHGADVSIVSNGFAVRVVLTMQTTEPAEPPHSQSHIFSSEITANGDLRAETLVESRLDEMYVGLCLRAGT